MREVGALCRFLDVEEAIVSGSRGPRPRRAMVCKLQNRRPRQRSPHQHAKKVAPRTVPATGIMIARRRMTVRVRIIVGVSMAVLMGMNVSIAVM